MKYGLFATALLFSCSSIAYAQTMPNPNRPNSYVANEGWEASISGFNFLQLDSSGYLYVDCVGCSGGGGGGGGAITAAANSYATGFSPDFGSLTSTAYNGSNTASLLAIEKADYNQLLLLSTSANQLTQIGYLSTIATNSGTQALASKQATINADGGSQIHIMNASLGVTQYQSPWVTSTTQGGTATSATNGLYIQPTTAANFNVTVTTSALPAGAATSANQPAINGDGGALSHIANTVSSPVPISEVAAATGGALTYSAQGGTSNALLTATPVTIKTGAGSIYGWDFVNTGTSAVWVQVFDATSVTLGTTVPLQSKWVPVGAWEEKFPVGVAFVNGLMLAATTTPTGSTAPATGINANVEYK